MKTLRAQRLIEIGIALLAWRVYCADDKPMKIPYIKWPRRALNTAEVEYILKAGLARAKKRELRKYAAEFRKNAGVKP